jgi:hypothetical protein
MGFWGRLFGTDAKEIDHPVLGRMSRFRSYFGQGFGWGIKEVHPLGFRGEPSLSLNGDENGPTADCVSTYTRLRKEWNIFGPIVAKELFQVNQDYFSDEPGRALHSIDEVWGSSENPSIDIYGEGSFSLTFEFDWQDPRDGHITTVYFQDWRPHGIAVDG